MGSPSDQVTVEQGLMDYEHHHLAARNYAARTRREYLTDLRQLGEYLEGSGVTHVQAVQRTHLEGFLASLDRQAQASSTRRRKVAVVRSFFRFLERAGLRTGDPAADLVP